jgi:hypothetical protein
MWPFLDKPVVQTGVVFYRGPIGPPLEQVRALASGDIGASRTASCDDDVTCAWTVSFTHPTWGDSLVGAPRDDAMPGDDLIRYGARGLTDHERDQLALAETCLLVRATSPAGSVLQSRKHLLRWLRLLLGLDGIAASDLASQVFWSRGMLDDELAHDADLARDLPRLGRAAPRPLDAHPWGSRSWVRSISTSCAHRRFSPLTPAMRFVRWPLPRSRVALLRPRRAS